MGKDILDECYEEATRVLERNIFPGGFFASPGYHAIWARDSMITSLGGSLILKFQKQFRDSLITLGGHQSKLGQIPNAILEHRGRKKQVDFLSIDSTLWFVIGEYVYRKRFGSELFRKHAGNIKRAVNWLEYQNFSEKGILAQLPTTDWQDAFPHRYGHTINTQALYYKVLNLIGEKEKAEKLKKAVNEIDDLKLWNGSFYLPWRWKNHGKYKEEGEWFDSLGNLLAIVFELADDNRAEKILAHIKKNKINFPFPVKAIYPPIKKGSKDWQDYFDDCNAKTPYHYLNGGVWTYIGGFYILALIKLGKTEEAECELTRLAEANLMSQFSEWIDGETGKTNGGGNQAWNAGMYILAYESFKKGKALL
ncbi:MAG: glycoside hydrolase 100 family protein [Nanoarchaeota archaeon]